MTQAQNPERKRGVPSSPPPPIALPNYLISTDKSLLDINTIHTFLAASYWSPNISRAAVECAIQHSLCFGVYHHPAAAPHPAQVGFARIITDGATFAYLADVFVLDAHRGQGLGKFLMRTILAHPDLQGLRRIMLLTRDAHDLYRQFGFEITATPDRVMEKRDAAYATHPRWSSH